MDSSKSLAIKPKPGKSRTPLKQFDVENVRRSPRKKTATTEKGRRKLDFNKDKKKLSKDRLKGFIVYVDVSAPLKQKEIKERVKSLGGRVEEFLDKIVNLVVTNQKPIGKNESTGNAMENSPMSAMGPSPLQQPLSNKNCLMYSPYSTDSPQHSIEGLRKEKVVLSRGQKLINKVLSNRKGAGTADIRETAKNIGAKVISLGDFSRKFMQKRSISEGSIKGLKSKQQNNLKKGGSSTRTLADIQVTKLNVPFFKIEDETWAFRPITHETKEWPKLHYGTSLSQTPFDVPKIKSKAKLDTPRDDEPNSNRYDEETISIAYKSEKMSDQLEEKELKKTEDKKEAKKAGEKAGYCDCCTVRYKDLRKHLKSDSHRRFARDPSNFKNLDALINNGTNFHKFLNDLKAVAKLQELNRNLFADRNDQDHTAVSTVTTTTTTVAASTRDVVCSIETKIKKLPVPQISTTSFTKLSPGEDTNLRSPYKSQRRSPRKSPKIPVMEIPILDDPSSDCDMRTPRIEDILTTKNGDTFYYPNVSTPAKPDWSSTTVTTSYTSHGCPRANFIPNILHTSLIGSRLVASPIEISDPDVLTMRENTRNENATLNSPPKRCSLNSQTIETPKSEDAKHKDPKRRVKRKRRKSSQRSSQSQVVATQEDDFTKILLDSKEIDIEYKADSIESIRKMKPSHVEGTKDCLEDKEIDIEYKANSIESIRKPKPSHVKGTKDRLEDSAVSDCLEPSYIAEPMQCAVASDPEITFNTKCDPLLEILLSPHRKKAAASLRWGTVENSVPLGERLKKVQAGEKLTISPPSSYSRKTSLREKQVKTSSTVSSNALEGTVSSNALEGIVAEIPGDSDKELHLNNSTIPGGILRISYVEENFSADMEIVKEGNELEPCLTDLDSSTRRTATAACLNDQPQSDIMFSDDDEPADLMHHINTISNDFAKVEEEFQHVDDVSVAILKRGSTPKGGKVLKSRLVANNEEQLSPAMTVTNPPRTPLRNKSGVENLMLSPLSCKNGLRSAKAFNEAINQVTCQQTPPSLQSPSRASKKRRATTPGSERSRKRSRTSSSNSNKFHEVKSKTTKEKPPPRVPEMVDDVFHMDEQPVEFGEMQTVTSEQKTIGQDVGSESLQLKQIDNDAGIIVTHHGSALYDRIKHGGRKAAQAASISMSQSSSRSASPCSRKHSETEHRDNPQVRTANVRRSPRKKNLITPKRRISPRKSTQQDSEKLITSGKKLKQKRSPFGNPKALRKNNNVNILNDFEAEEVKLQDQSANTSSSRKSKVRTKGTRNNDADSGSEAEQNDDERHSSSRQIFFSPKNKSGNSRKARTTTNEDAEDDDFDVPTKHRMPPRKSR